MPASSKGIWGLLARPQILIFLKIPYYLLLSWRRWRTNSSTCISTRMWVVFSLSILLGFLGWKIYCFLILFEWDLSMRSKEKSEGLKVAPRLSAPNNFRNSRTSIPTSSRMCRQGIRMSSRLCGLPRTSFWRNRKVILFFSQSTCCSWWELFWLEWVLFCMSCCRTQSFDEV